MTTCRRGDLVVVEVRYSDGTGSKRRPALVVSEDGYNRRLPDVMACPVSSQPRYVEHPGPADVPIAAWKPAGLRHPSAVRVGKTLAIDRGIVLRRLGRMPEETMREVGLVLRRLLAL